MRHQSNIGKILILTGPTGVGKDTVGKELIKNGWKKVVTYTTRKPREGEIEGVHYHFVTLEQFHEMNQRGEFFETNQYGESFYGTAKKTFSAIIDGTNLLWIIDSVTASNIKNIFAQRLEEQIRDLVLDNTIVIYLKPSSWEELEKRLITRDGDHPEILEKQKKRLEQDHQIWLSHTLHFDAIVENKDGRLEETFKGVVANLQA